ncbi:uncharacterized protein OCT59_028825 [Rhizophagus irregularis]|uniref:uncharacterized protein n=1 Tax=Rhizophagus irregularis TaxID=588596 RepID=UPI00333082ED|nr:hypothetical protein OCT59_028825 [Rhizophagus irregularis]
MVKILLFTVQRNGFGGHGITIGGLVIDEDDANVGAAFIDALQITTCKSFGICERRKNSRDASTHQINGRKNNYQQEEWENMRGVYNTNFNKLSKNKESKEIVKKLWNFIYEEIKRRIWIKRCDEIAEIEKKEDLAKMTLKKRKNKDNLEGENTSGGKVGIENNGKNKKQKTEEKFKKK